MKVYKASEKKHLQKPLAVEEMGSYDEVDGGQRHRHRRLRPGRRIRMAAPFHTSPSSEGEVGERSEPGIFVRN